MSHLLAVTEIGGIREAGTVKLCSVSQTSRVVFNSLGKKRKRGVVLISLEKKFKLYSIGLTRKILLP